MEQKRAEKEKQEIVISHQFLARYDPPHLLTFFFVCHIGREMTR